MSGKQPHVLIVDDEVDLQTLLKITLAKMHIVAASAGTLREAYTLLANNAFDLCLTDLKLPDGNGIELVQYIQTHHANLPVAVITAYGSMDSAIQALKAGAFDFVSKPIELAILRNLITTALKLSSSQPTASSHDFTLLGESPAMQSLKTTIVKLSRSQAPVHIHGESGTGKELVARLIHSQSPRAENPFVAINCGAIPHDLMESEFFGHKKGSFTGAYADKEGLFQTAHGGTILLDEIAELPLHMQVKLLRAIQEKSIRPVGASQEISVDVRILSATHKDLTQLVQSGEFRQDLYYRINVIAVRVPPLRERPEDIPLLVNHFLKRLSPLKGHGPAQLTPEAMTTLQHYTFPGNVRELENILERAVTLQEGESIQIKDLQLSQTYNTTQFSLSSGQSQSLESYLCEVEKKAILEALNQTGHNKTAAAKLLGITFRTLRYRLKKLELD